MTCRRPRYRRAASTLWLATSAAAVLALAACGSAHRQSANGAQASALPLDAAVAVRFTAPASIELADAGATSDGSSFRRVSGVQTLSGRVHRVAGDSIWIALTTLTTEAERETFPRRPKVVARVHQGPETRVEVLSSSPAMVHGIAGGAVAVTVGALLALVVYCSEKGCLN